MSAFNILEQILGKGVGGLLGGLQQPAPNKKTTSSTQSNSPNTNRSALDIGMDMLNQIQNKNNTTPKPASSEPSSTQTTTSNKKEDDALSILLGDNKSGSKLTTINGLAALGTIAFKAYQHWQELQIKKTSAVNQVAQAQGIAQSMPQSITMPESQKDLLNVLPEFPPTHQDISVTIPPAIENVSRALLVAMIAAAKADGHIQEDEKAQLNTHLAKLQNPQDRQWFQAELERHVDPCYVASYATNAHLAAQMYAISIAICKTQNFMEKVYLNELATQLKLAPELKAEIDEQVQLM